MKKLIYLFAVLFGTSTMASANTIIANGSFENGVMDTWVHAYTSGQATFNLEQTVVRDGTKGLRVDVTQAGSGITAISSTNSSFAKTAETTYLARFWAKSSGDATDLYVAVQGSTTKQVHYVLRDHWVLYHLPFKTTDTNINLKFYYPSVSTYYIDGVEILDQNSGDIDVSKTYLWNDSHASTWGWTAADNDISLTLPDGRVANFFNDSFYSHPNSLENPFPTTDSKFLRNSMVVQEADGLLYSKFAGTQATTTRYFECIEPTTVTGVDNFYWIGDAIMDGNKIKVYLVELLNQSGGAVATGRTYVAQLSYPGLVLEKIVKQPSAFATYETFFNDDDFLYIYSIETVGWDKYAHIARTTKGNLMGQNGALEYYNGSAWVTDPAQSARVNNSAAESVIKIQNGNYAMVSMPVLSREVRVSFAQNPQGPWTASQLIYTIPNDEQYWYYMPNIHEQLPNGKFSISYSVNGWEDWGNSFKDKYWYRQRYIQTDLKALSPYTTTKTNIALNKTVTVSSTTGTNTGAKAVDANATTRWESTYSDAQWITVDLGNNYNVNNIKVVWEASCAKNYTIQVSDNNTTWTDVKTIKNNSSLTNLHDNLNFTGRYVRLNCTARATMWGYSIYELEVNGTLIYNQDITYLGGTTTTQYTDSPAAEGVANLIDDNSGTKFLTFHNAAWVQFQTAGSYVVNKYMLTSANDAPDRDPLSWTLQGSNNGTTWTTIDTRTNQDFPNRFQKLTFTFTNTTVYKYFRFNFTNNTGTVLQLAEIELVGSAVGALRSAEIPESIEQSVAKSEVVIYPNPVVDVLNVSGVNDDVKVELYNSVGVKVKMEVGKTINVSDLKAGVYVARVTNDGKTVNKVIIKK